MVVLPAVILNSSSAGAAAAGEFVYAQKTGRLTLDGKPFASGYSGHGVAKDDPDKERVKNEGPIPRGVYRIGTPRTFKGMADCFDLTPVGHDARGRTEFLIHGDSKSAPGTASNGCIILPPAIRRKIAGSGVLLLRVVRE